jgi:hypothetical protein
MIAADTPEGEAAVAVSVAPWDGWLIPILDSCLESPGERYAGFRLETKGDFINLVKIDGSEPPADWAAKVEAMGYGKGGAKGGPGAGSAGGGDRRALVMHGQTVAAGVFATLVASKAVPATIAGFDALAQHVVDKLFERRAPAKPAAQVGGAGSRGLDA